VPFFEGGQICLIRLWRCASSKLGGPEPDAATRTNNDVLLPADMAAHMGQPLSKSELLAASGALLRGGTDLFDKTMEKLEARSAPA
jgi:hypothetical protein